MDERVVGALGRRRSRAEAAALAEYEASGLSRLVFCARHGLAVGTLDRQRRSCWKLSDMATSRSCAFRARRLTGMITSAPNLDTGHRQLQGRFGIISDSAVAFEFSQRSVSSACHDERAENQWFACGKVRY